MGNDGKAGRGWGAAGALVLLLGLFAGCSQGDLAAVDEANPYYQKGEELRQLGQAGEAVKAYERCLFYSPRSTKAHWAAAKLYADSLHDWPHAIVHYQACVADATDDASRAQAASVLASAQAAYYAELAKTYSPATTLAGGAVIPPLPPPADAVAAAPVVPPTPPEVTPVPAAAPVVEPRVHLVKSGDTLTTISRQYYGDGRKWQLILDANRGILSAPEKLHAGQRLVIPPAEKAP